MIFIALHNKKSPKNYLDYIPSKNPSFPWSYNEDNLVVIEICHTGFFNKMAQKLFKMPAKSKISLDEYGTFIWEVIDGQKNILAISNLVHEKFEDKAEPLLERLIKFFQILHTHQFII